jgi:hypothetical protein
MKAHDLTAILGTVKELYVTPGRSEHSTAADPRVGKGDLTS